MEPRGENECVAVQTSAAACWCLADACPITDCLQEDQRLQELVRLHGPKKWSQIATDLNTNKGSKQVRCYVSALPSLAVGH